MCVPDALGGTAATTSSPIAITSDNARVWVVNPDNDSVTVINVAGDANTVLAEIPVGDSPARLAILPDNSKVYVSNQRSGTVSVINANTFQVITTIEVGTEPTGVATRVDGTIVYVANFSSDTVSVIATANDTVGATIPVGPKPRGIAVTEEGFYVSLFLAQLRDDSAPVDEQEGFDDGKEGRVVFVQFGGSPATIVLDPLANTGFNANGSLLDGIPPVDPPVFTTPTGAFPNQLDSIFIRGDRAYLPNIGASPNGPVRFNVNVQSLLSVIDINTNLDSGQTINMNQGVQFEPVGERLFITNPLAVAFKPGSDEGFVVSGATDRLVRVVVDGSGTPTINAPTGPGDPGNVVRIELGVDPPGQERNSNPHGLAINSTGTRAYVMNLISRDVSVVNISGDPSTYAEIDRIQTASLPLPGTLEEKVHRGHELFNTSIGPAGTNENALPPAGRMSDFGWGSCVSCHPGGLHDGVTWMFGDGPRQTISMESTFMHPQGDENLNANGAPLLAAFHQRMLNWSAVRDEVQDFELNIRGVSGGQGLITDGQMVFNLTPTANTGRSADLDMIAAYIAFGIPAPLSPTADANVTAGRLLFTQAFCHTCHGGKNWNASRVRYTPPPTTPPITITGGQIVNELRQVGTFDPSAANEVRIAGTPPAIVTANGALGFNPPSLLSVFAGAPYLHSGAAETLEDVLDNVTHRAAGLGGKDVLTDPGDRADLVAFLKSIDETTVTVPLSADINGDGVVNAADLAQLLSEWGPGGSAPAGTRSDLNEDGLVNPADLAQLLAEWTF
jgi:YVTN family beta-propeller protein